ncbi:MAG TPA: hypothetical protein VFK43_11570, partial [Acidimicrobiales bacterium]|nr:hypothetical protein [Acidimicrobiales bacterium]
MTGVVEKARSVLGGLPEIAPRWRPAAGAIAAMAAWAVLAAVLPHGMPAGIVLLGVVLGSLTGLSAIGLVLVYRASRIVNFSQASLGSAAGVLAILVFTSWGWNYFLCLALGAAVAAATGALVERVVIRRFFWAPRLILTLATIGLAQLLGGIEGERRRERGAERVRHQRLVEQRRQAGFDAAEHLGEPDGGQGEDEPRRPEEPSD